MSTIQRGFSIKQLSNVTVHSRVKAPCEETTDSIRSKYLTLSPFYTNHHLNFISSAIESRIAELRVEQGWFCYVSHLQRIRDLMRVAWELISRYNDLHVILICDIFVGKCNKVLDLVFYLCILRWLYETRTIMKLVVFYVKRKLLIESYDVEIKSWTVECIFYSTYLYLNKLYLKMWVVWPRHNKAPQFNCFVIFKPFLRTTFDFNKKVLQTGLIFTITTIKPLSI